MALTSERFHLRVGTHQLANIGHEDRCISRTHGHRCALNPLDSLDVSKMIISTPHGPRAHLRYHLLPVLT